MRTLVAWSRRRRGLIALILVSALAGACATQPETFAAADGIPGFFSGLLHGFGAWFGFFASFFGAIEMYAWPNAGWPYDLGFLCGFSMFVGFGLQAGR